jgi:hypothetical protein
VTERSPKWRWGAPSPEQPKLQLLLDALRRLRDGGLTAARLVTAFHRRRVLPLMARRLRLDQMEEGAPLEGCWMSDASLMAVEVTRRVAYTVAAGFAVADLNRIKMRPTRGYISLVSLILVRAEECPTSSGEESLVLPCIGMLVVGGYKLVEREELPGLKMC